MYVLQMICQICSRATRINENFVTFVTFCFLLEFVPLEMFPNSTNLWATDINKNIVWSCINRRIKPPLITWKMWRKTNVNKQLISKGKQNFKPFKTTYYYLCNSKLRINILTSKYQMNGLYDVFSIQNYFSFLTIFNFIIIINLFSLWC